MERQRGAGLWRGRAIDTVEAVPVANKECVVLAPYTAAALRMELWRGEGLWRRRLFVERLRTFRSPREIGGYLGGLDFIF
jgi:hypothetical protein